jgi:hypothetical protein
MAINKNHEFEDLDGVKCAVVEKNASKERVAFLKELLEWNGYKVVVVPSPPPKVAPAPKPAEGEEAVVVESPAIPVIETFTIGVSDVMFNATNAVFGRLLKTKSNQVVTQAYWLQQDLHSNDHIPYFANEENIQSWK